MGLRPPRVAPDPIEVVDEARAPGSRHGTAFDRRTWAGLVVLSVGVVVAHIPGPHATAWHWFHDAGRLLVGDGSVPGAGGLSLYVDHPEFQFGPLAVVAAVPFSWFGLGLGSWLAIIVGSALGLIALAALVTTVRRLRPDALRSARPLSLIGGAVTLVLVWGDVAVRTAHLDDAIALCALAAALWALSEGRTGWATVAVAIGAAAKPWAVIFLPLLLLVPDSRRFVRPVGAGLVAVLTWVPFLLAAPETLDVRDYAIPNEASSALRILGVTDPTTPDWVRPAQLLGGMALVGLLVLVGRWPAALMAGVAVRLVLDPAANRYYTVGLVLTVLVFEWVERPERVPWLAVASAVLLEGSQLEGVPATLGGWMRVAVVAAVLVTAAGYRPSAGVELGRGDGPAVTSRGRPTTSRRARAPAAGSPAG